MTSLNVSNNGVLTSINCANNDLTRLIANNGNNTSITTFVASLNPSLTCIGVDDAAYSTANWTNIDVQTSFSEDCNQVSQSSTSINLNGTGPFPYL